MCSKNVRGFKLLVTRPDTNGSVDRDFFRVRTLIIDKFLVTGWVE